MQASSGVIFQSWKQKPGVDLICKSSWGLTMSSCLATAMIASMTEIGDDINSIAAQAFMKQHDFSSIEDFRGSSLPFFTTHHELVRMQREAIDAKKRARQGLASDADWSGDGFVRETESMVAN